LTFDNAFDFSKVKFGLGARLGKGDNEKHKEAYRQRGYSVSFGYHTANFLSSSFRNYVKDGNIKRQFGMVLNYRITALYPLMFDLEWFSSRFSVNNLPNWPNNDSIKVRHRGIEVSALLPLVSNKTITPYYGAGYQFSQLLSGLPFIKSDNVDYSNISEMKLNTSGLIVKGGIMINMGNATLSFDYKRSVFNKKSPYEQFAIKLGMYLD
jgi:hypothetical protein